MKTSAQNAAAGVATRGVRKLYVILSR